MDNLGLSHTRWNCIYHIVFISKYRRRIMYVSILPKLTLSEFMGFLKRKSSLQILISIHSMEPSGKEIFGREATMLQR